MYLLGLMGDCPEVCYAASWALQGEPDLLATGPKDQSALGCYHRTGWRSLHGAAIT